jgi:hypothetical protein
MSITDSERSFAVQYLEQTRDRVLALAQWLTPEQRSFRPSESDWSAGELIEHIVVVENFVLSFLEAMIKEGTPDESRRGAIAHKDQIVLEAVPARTIHAQAPEFLRPTQRWADFDDLLREFAKTRGRTIEFAGTTQADLRAYFRPHPLLKDLDAYQWLLLVGSHAERHVRQAEEGLAAKL